jgi:hypothetical protein
MWSKLKETIQHEMKAIIQSIQSELDETTTCNKVTVTKHNPGMMQYIEELQEIPKGKAAVMPAGELRKRHRVWNLAVERRQKQKERTRGKSGSRRKSASACTKVSRHTKVGWQKRKFVRRIGTQENCGPQKEFSPARIRVTHSAKVTQGKEHGLLETSQRQ